MNACTNQSSQFLERLRQKGRSLNFSNFSLDDNDSLARSLLIHQGLLKAHFYRISCVLKELVKDHTVAVTMGWTSEFSSQCQCEDLKEKIGVLELTLLDATNNLIMQNREFGECLNVIKSSSDTNSPKNSCFLTPKLVPASYFGSLNPSALSPIPKTIEYNSITDGEGDNAATTVKPIIFFPKDNKDNSNSADDLIDGQRGTPMTQSECLQPTHEELIRKIKNKLLELSTESFKQRVTTADNMISIQDDGVQASKSDVDFAVLIDHGDELGLLGSLLMMEKIVDDLLTAQPVEEPLRKMTDNLDTEETIIESIIATDDMKSNHLPPPMSSLDCERPPIPPPLSLDAMESNNKEFLSEFTVTQCTSCFCSNAKEPTQQSESGDISYDELLCELITAKLQLASTTDELLGLKAKIKRKLRQ